MPIDLTIKNSKITIFNDLPNSPSSWLYEYTPNNTKFTGMVYIRKNPKMRGFILKTDNSLLWKSKIKFISQLKETNQQDEQQWFEDSNPVYDRGAVR